MLRRLREPGEQLRYCFRVRIARTDTAVHKAKLLAESALDIEGQ